LGNAAVEQLIAGRSNACVGVVNSEVLVTPFHEAIYKSKSINQTLWNLSKILSN
jgi:6-phosphofructokinase